MLCDVAVCTFSGAANVVVNAPASTVMAAMSASEKDHPVRERAVMQAQREGER